MVHGLAHEPRMRVRGGGDDHSVRLVHGRLRRRHDRPAVALRGHAGMPLRTVELSDPASPDESDPHHDLPLRL